MFSLILINFTLSTFHSFGNMIPYIVSYVNCHSFQTSATTFQAAQLTPAYLLGHQVASISRPFIEKCSNTRMAIVIGCSVYCLSIFLTIAAIQIHIFCVIIVYGFGTGFGSGLAESASIVFSQKKFPSTNKDLLAGAFIVFRALGALLSICMVTYGFNRLNQTSRFNNQFVTETRYIWPPYIFALLGVIFTVVQGAACLLLVRCNEQETGDEDTKQKSTKTRSEQVVPIDDAKSAFGYCIFYSIGFMMIFVLPGLIIGNSLSKVLGQSYIMDDKFLALVIGLAAISYAIGEIFWSLLITQVRFSICYTIYVVLYITLALIFQFTVFLENQNSYMLWVLGVHFCISGTLTLLSALVETIFGLKLHATIYIILVIPIFFLLFLIMYLLELGFGHIIDMMAEPEGKLRAPQNIYLILAAAYFLSLVILYCKFTFKDSVWRFYNYFKSRPFRQWCNCTKAGQSMQWCNCAKGGQKQSTPRPKTKSSVKKDDLPGPVFVVDQPIKDPDGGKKTKSKLRPGRSRSPKSMKSTSPKSQRSSSPRSVKSTRP